MREFKDSANQRYQIDVSDDDSAILRIYDSAGQLLSESCVPAYIVDSLVPPNLIEVTPDEPKD